MCPLKADLLSVTFDPETAWDPLAHCDPPYENSAFTVIAGLHTQRPTKFCHMLEGLRGLLSTVKRLAAITLQPSKLRYVCGTKRDFAVFARKIQLSSKKSATKFLCVKTFSGKVVATSFLYLKVHRRIAGDVPIYVKICAQSDPPPQKTPISTYLLNSPSVVIVSKKVSQILPPVVSLYSVFVFTLFLIFFVFVPCARLSWPSRQLLTARLSTLSYRTGPIFTKSFTIW